MSVFHSFQSRRKILRRPHRVRTMVEMLENRTLMSAAVFEADFNGSGKSMITTGAGSAMGPTNPTGSWHGTAGISSANPMDQNSYLDVNIAQSSGSAGVATTVMTPATNASLAQLGTSSGGYQDMNGAIDFFYRCDVAPSVQDNNWFRPIDTDNRSAGGLRLILVNQPGTNSDLRAELICNSSSGFTASGSKLNATITGNDIQLIEPTTESFSLTDSHVSHIAIAFTTVGNVVTMSLYGINNAGQIFTTANSPQLLAQASFTINAGQVTQGLTGDSFNFAGLTGNSAVTSFQQDFDSLRIYKGAQTSNLPGLVTSYTLQKASGDNNANGQNSNDLFGDFQKAMTYLQGKGPCILQLDAGTYDLRADPSLAESSMQQRDDPTLLIEVPANVTIQGMGTGTGGTTVEWVRKQAPEFCFSNANNSGMDELTAEYTGTYNQPSTTFDQNIGDVALLKALNYNIQYGHNNTIDGGSTDMDAFIFEVQSNNTSFHDLSFTTANNNETGCYEGFDVRGNGVIVGQTGVGGADAYATGNVFSNIAFDHTMMGMLIAGQQNGLIANITSNNRGYGDSGADPGNGAPGHVVYVQGQSEWNYDGKGDGYLYPNLNLTINTVVDNGISSDGNNRTNGGTLAYKDTQNSLVENITSFHPMGVFESINSCQNDIIKNVTWTYNGVPDSVFLEPNIMNTDTDIAPDESQTNNMTYDQITITAPDEPVLAAYFDGNTFVTNMTITTEPDYISGQTQRLNVITLRDSTDSTLGTAAAPIAYHIQLGSEWNPPGPKGNSYNNAFQGLIDGSNPDINSDVYINIYWPSWAIKPPGMNTNGSSAVWCGWQNGPASGDNIYPNFPPA